MTDFFREVDEDYRRDQALAFWKRYQNWIIAAALLVVMGTAAWRIYDNFRVTAAETAGGRYEAALQMLRDGQSAPALAVLEALGSTGPKGYAGLARLVAADEIGAHDAPAALKAFDALIADPNLDQSLKDLAQVRAALLRIDTDQPKQFEQRYAALADSEQPYRNSIRELLALAALKDGDDTAAGHWLDAIVTDPSAPDSLRRRAEAFLALVQAGKLPGPPKPDK